eukprot:SRR837773.16824.p1 GENE.SRR837773.16824~~SRR837773.16824.p1  ORF type:complete len:526 (-),score=166.36 SRR837773.16824:293-1870(-)
MGEELPWQFMALYTTTIIPVRFYVCGPLCALMPVAYAAAIVRYGSPLPEARAAMTAKHYGIMIVLIEAVGGLGFICLFALAGKYFNEVQERVAFVSRLNAFNTIQELTAVEETAGSAPVDKARTALNGAAKALEVASANGDKEAILRAKTQVDFALGLLRNISKFFEVSAEDLLKGTSVEGNSEFVAYLKQDDHHEDEGPAIGKQGSLRKTKFNSLVTKHQSSVTQMANHVKIQCPSELVAGWGEDWGFSALPVARQTGNAALLFAAEHAFVNTGANGVLGVDADCIRRWVREIHCRYSAAAYHNEAHAAQVAHFSYWFAKKTGLLDNAEPTHMCALLIASIAHDVGHFGKTSLFLQKTSHSISIIWNDASILENMHSALCFSTMRGPAAILDGLDGATKAKVRLAITRFILATDVKNHNSALAKLKAMMDDRSFLSDLDERDAAQVDEEVLTAGSSSCGRPTSRTACSPGSTTRSGPTESRWSSWSRATWRRPWASPSRLCASARSATSQVVRRSSSITSAWAC